MRLLIPPAPLDYFARSHHHDHRRPQCLGDPTHSIRSIQKPFPSIRNVVSRLWFTSRNALYLQKLYSYLQPLLGAPRHRTFTDAFDTSNASNINSLPVDELIIDWSKPTPKSTALLYNFDCNIMARKYFVILFYLSKRAYFERHSTGVRPGSILLGFNARQSMG